ncbi:MAG: hypothetical protein WBA87_11855 [Microbacterium sp.]
MTRFRLRVSLVGSEPEIGRRCGSGAGPAHGAAFTPARASA